MHAKTRTRLSEVFYRERFAASLPTRTRPTLFTPLSAMTRLPSGVDLILRDASSAPGMIQFFRF